ncbi:MAG: bifunctional demethylmenaquinone methyltransferase/2-methoxy-6-polyprenyl-1,4-benzoquinol methylase UbiE [Rhabdochlamydiaceae bacterium]|nr:bifunctional demethylmenaquinone methyltransferase/2-methoxy-6-polyprenyl-1,4-benzoquinol methylase UbiE [Rhabdochlamydiaceae bacterium]
MQTPLKEPSRQEIWKMFDQISATYDRVNRVMTFGLDQYWRKKMCRLLPQGKQLKVLDCATGTGDQIICLKENALSIDKVVGIDLAAEMVALAQKKIAQKPYASQIKLQVASALEIPYPDATFDCITISFGIRNVTDVLGCLKEFVRVLKPGGRALILEGTLPANPLLRRLHLFYMRHLLPYIGGWISKKQDAYRYLNKTIETFPCGDAFIELMLQAGFTQSTAHLMNGGIVTIYQGDKANA